MPSLASRARSAPYAKLPPPALLSRRFQPESPCLSLGPLSSHARPHVRAGETRVSLHLAVLVSRCRCFSGDGSHASPLPCCDDLRASDCLRRLLFPAAVGREASGTRCSPSLSIALAGLTSVASPPRPSCHWPRISDELGPSSRPSSRRQWWLAARGLPSHPPLCISCLAGMRAPSPAAPADVTSPRNAPPGGLRRGRVIPTVPTAILLPLPGLRPRQRPPLPARRLRSQPRVPRRHLLRRRLRPPVSRFAASSFAASSSAASPPWLASNRSTPGQRPFLVTAAPVTLPASGTLPQRVGLRSRIHLCDHALFATRRPSALAASPSPPAATLGLPSARRSPSDGDSICAKCRPSRRALQRSPALA
ncbi:unnamed protein product [Closterium sp. NIES-64]|nr:unnamed protein product [Closterium sp. NIES-64]